MAKERDAMFTDLLALSLLTDEILKVDLKSGKATPLPLDTGHCPDGIVVIDDIIYWTTMGAIPQAKPGEDPSLLKFKDQDGQVRSASLDGDTVTNITCIGEFTTGKQLTTDGKGILYFSDREGCKVWSVGVDGSNLTELIVNDPADGDDAECVGCAVDASYLYWTQKGAGDGSGKILRAGLEIPEGETAENRSDIEVLWDNLPEPIDLELHDGYMYWTDRGHGEGGNSLNRAPLPKAGKTGQKPEIISKGFQDTIGLAIDAAAEVIYVADLAGAIYSVEMPGISEHDTIAEKSSDKPQKIFQHDNMLTGLTGIK